MNRPPNPLRLSRATGRAGRFGAKAADARESIIPLLHVPDDPGPEAAADLDPEPEPPGGSRGLAAVQISTPERAAGLLANAQPRPLRRAQFRRFRPVPA